MSPVSGTQVLPSTNPLGSAFNLEPWYNYGIQYYEINFNNPTLGPAFKQLYVRQAIQELVDQEGMTKTVQRGYAYPTTGGVPTQPTNQWIPSVQNSNGGQGPYPFSVATATTLLTSHGWKNVGGVMTCETASKCGAGVTAGTKLSMTMDYATGVTVLPAGGRDLQVRHEPGGHLDQPGAAVLQHDHRRDRSPASPPQAACKWQRLYFGGWNFNGPGFEPTGEPLFQTGAIVERRQLLGPARWTADQRDPHQQQPVGVPAVRDVHRRAAAVHLDAERLHGHGGDSKLANVGLQPARHAPARVLELHQVTSG